MLTELARRYRWADEEPDLVWTVAVVDGRSAEDVVHEYRGEPVGEFAFARLAEVQGDADEPRAHLQLIVHSGLVVAVEHCGWTGIAPGVARRLSAGGQFFAVHWSLSTNPRLVQAVRGELVAHVEMFAGAKPYAGEPAPAWLADVTVPEVGALRSTALALMEQQTGLAFERGWLAERRATYRVPGVG